MRVLDLARIAFVGTAAIAALSSAARAADFDDDQRVCSQPGVGADVRIVVCTRQIESGRLEGAGLAVPYNSRGFAYREKSDVDHAIADFSQAIQLNPKYTFAWFNRGKTYADKKDLDHAVADYSEAIKLDPNNIDAYYLRGKAYLAKKDYDGAIADYNHLIEGNPKIAAAVYNDRGVAYTNKNDIDRAIADYSQAIQLDPKDAQAYTNRALMYQAKGDLDHAIADFTQTIALKPSFGLYYSRAIAYRDKRDYDDAIADYSKAIEINPKQLDLIHNRAAAYRHKGDFRSAMADYTREIELDPKLWAAFFSRGHLAVLTGALPEGMADLTKAAELSPGNAYVALSIEIASRHSNAASRLVDASKQLDMKSWPAPVVQFYLGQLTPEALMTAANSGDAAARMNQTCGANYYIGEYYLWQGKKDDARRLFALAAKDDCRGDILALEGARAALKALDAKS